MHSRASKVTSKGQIVIHKKLREKYGIHPFTTVHWLEKREGLMMVPEKEDPVIAARGMLAKTGILKKYLRFKRKEKDLEDRRFANKKPRGNG